VSNCVSVSALHFLSLKETFIHVPKFEPTELKMKMLCCGQAKITKINPRDVIPKPYKIELLFMNAEPRNNLICLFSSQSSNSPYNRGGGELLKVSTVEV